ncbi:MAG: YfhO family protein [Chitinophagaceae bacterium]
MQKTAFQKLLPHLIAIVIFLIVALVYCKPTLEGKVLQQTDITQWKAMAQNSFEYKEKHGHLPLWTNGMFSGMPAYQIAMEPDVIVTPMWFHGFATLFLPKPIAFFFLACICFYFLSQVLRINPYIGIIGALAYAYATYNPIIVAAGHDTKMYTLAYLPAFIASLILIYERKYWWGAALTAVCTALLITFSHMQIVYYSLIIAIFMTVGYVVYWIQRKEIKHLLIAGGIAIGAGLLGVMSNAVQILTILESSKTSIRGGTELSDQNSTKTGLSKEYAFSYSMYKTEPFVMMVPKMYGGSSGLEIKEEDSKAIEQLQQSASQLTQELSAQMPQQNAQQAAQQILGQIQQSLSFYWGGIGGTSGPPYVGAIICFLVLIGFFILDNKHKWWILGASVFAIIMSWGGFFNGFNTFLLNNLPLYNKFRAPSMTIVIPTFLFCMMAVMTLQKIVATEKKMELWERYKKGLMLTAGVFVVLLLIYFSSDFQSEGDKRLMGWAASLPEQFKLTVENHSRSFLNALEDDRKSLFFGSLVRSFFFIAAAAVVLWLMIKKNFSKWASLAIIGLLAFIDVIAIGTKYLNEDNYQDVDEYQNNFAPTAVDQQIQQDSGYYRVLDLRQGIHNAFNGGALTMYHHQSIGGYHPAKLSIYQDLIEHQLYNFPQSMPVVNMLNTKYIIQADESGKEGVYTNNDALGAAWFVNDVRFEKDGAAVMNALTNFHPKDTAILFAADQNKIATTPSADSAATIQLIANDNDEVTYKSNSLLPRFAVFSEVYYDKGWKAFINDKETPIIRTNYVLRGLQVPAGQHNIKFIFHPASFYTGEKIALWAGILVMLLILAAGFQTYRSNRKTTA